MASPSPETGFLYYGDNLEVLREKIAPKSVDLVYLDPPFNSKQDYNVLFSESPGVKSHAQIKAFTDTWTWDDVAEETYKDIVSNAPAPVVTAAITCVNKSRVARPPSKFWDCCDFWEGS